MKPYLRTACKDIRHKSIFAVGHWQRWRQGRIIENDSIQLI